MLSTRLTSSLVVILALAGAAIASPTTLPAQVIGPDRVLQIQPEARVHGMAVSPDGKTAYLLMTGRDVELTRQFVRFWPELLGGIVCLWTARRVLGVLRRPQDADVAHCRRCNYNLTGLSSQRCPECGTLLTARTQVRGRSTWRRLIVPVGLFAVVAGAYLAADLRAWRHPAIPAGLQWRAIWPATWAMERDVRWLRPYLEQRDVLAAVDLERGGIRRALCNWPATERFGRETVVLVSRDGRNIITGGPRAEASLYQVDAATGKVLRRYPRDAGSNGWPSVGLLGDDLFTAAIAREGPAVVMSWRLSTGQKTGELVLPPLPEGGHRSSLQLVPNENHLLAVEYASSPFDMRIHVIDPQPLAVVRSFPVERIHVYYACRDRCSSQMPSAGLAVLTMPNGRLQEREATLWDIGSGRCTRTIAQPPPELAPPDRVARRPGEALLDRIDITPDGRLLLGSMFGQSRRLAVYDLASDRWLGAIDTTGSVYAGPYPAISPDARLYVAARRATTHGGHDLAVYDLTRWGVARDHVSN